MRLPVATRSNQPAQWTLASDQSVSSGQVIPPSVGGAPGVWITWTVPSNERWLMTRLVIWDPNTITCASACALYVNPAPYPTVPSPAYLADYFDIGVNANGGAGVSAPNQPLVLEPNTLVAAVLTRTANGATPYGPADGSVVAGRLFRAVYQEIQ